MVDTLGGAVRVNNLLSALDLKVINHNNLKSMEGRAGEVIEAFANSSSQKAAEDAYKKEMLWILYIFVCEKLHFCKMYLSYYKKLNISSEVLICTIV